MDFSKSGLPDLASYLREKGGTGNKLDLDAVEESEISLCGDDYQFLVELEGTFRSGDCNYSGVTIPGYEVFEQIGSGGMGVVYFARQTSLDRDVAIKLISADRVCDDKYRRRFENEALAASQLFHPHIVPIYDFGIWNDIPWIAMQFVDGQSLEQLLRDQDHDLMQNLSEEEKFSAIAKLGAEVADALQSAHEQGIFHRDIKPSNLMLDRFGKMWIVDFGLAKRTNEDNKLSLTGEVIGTPKYIAPEQVRGSVDARTDIYGLGITLYEFVVGTPLDAKLLTGDRQKAELTDIRKLAPKTPYDLAEIVMKMCAFHPQDRYQNANEVVSVLQRFASGEKIVDRRTSKRDTAFRPYLRKHFLALLLTIAAFSGFLLSRTLFNADSDFGESDAAYVWNDRLAETALATQQLVASEEVYRKAANLYQSDKGFKVTNIEYDCWPRNDGSIRIREQLTMKFHEPTRSVSYEFRKVEMSGLTITEPSGLVYAQSENRVDNTFHVENDDDDTIIHVYPNAKTEERTFIFEYVLLEESKPLRDAVEFRHTLFSKNCEELPVAKFRLHSGQTRPMSVWVNEIQKVESDPNGIFTWGPHQLGYGESLRSKVLFESGTFGDNDPSDSDDQAEYISKIKSSISRTEIDLTRNPDSIQKIAVPEKRKHVCQLKMATGDSWTLGGADCSQFVYSPTIQSIFFTSSVDYRRPRDSNKDNIYELELVNRSNGKKTLLEISVKDVDFNY